MAKAKTEAKTEKKSNLPVVEKPKFNVTNLSEDLGKSAAEVRVLLRKSDLEKGGGVWGWDKKADYEAALKTLKALVSTPKASAKEKPADKEKPAAKAPAKTAGKSTGKSSKKAA